MAVTTVNPVSGFTREQEIKIGMLIGGRLPSDFHHQWEKRQKQRRKCDFFGRRNNQADKCI